MLKEKIEIKADKLQLTKITNSGEKTIIVDKEKVGFDSINLKDINNYFRIEFGNEVETRKSVGSFEPTVHR